MRNIPPSLQAKLDTKVTTLCYAWILTCKDGTIYGATDHDEKLVIEGTPCMPVHTQTRFTQEQDTGLNTQSSDMEWGFRLNSIEPQDIENGKLDGADVSLYIVDWSEPSDNVLIQRGTIDRIEQTPNSFRAEIVDAFQKFRHINARSFSSSCDAILADNRCGVNLNDPEFIIPATLTQIHDNMTLTCTPTTPQPADIIRYGFLTLPPQGEAPQRIAILNAEDNDGKLTITLSEKIPETLVTGQSLTLNPGCDKRLTTCSQRFQNASNFRGFAHIPGNNFVLSYPNKNATNAGKSRFGN